MPEAEQRARMHHLREVVRTNNVYRWAGTMLRDAVQLRQKNLLSELVDGQQMPAQPAGNPVGHGAVSHREFGGPVQ
jgi:trehalose 6-phosphate synthase